MRIPYRTRRAIGRTVIILAVIALALLLIWACWLLWLGRYVVYTPEGVKFDFDRTTMDIEGQPALPPIEQETVSIYYNEGENAINVSTELTFCRWSNHCKNRAVRFESLDYVNNKCF